MPKDALSELASSGPSGTITVQVFMSKLFHSRIQAHIWHLQAKPATNLPLHLALEDFYTGIVDLTDELIETYQGTKPIITNYAHYAYEDLNKDQVVKYFTNLLSMIDTHRVRLLIDSDLLNITDEIKTLIKRLFYKLK